MIFLNSIKPSRTYNADWEKEGVDFRLFCGVESDILEDGKLDHPDDVLAEIDYVVASVHAMSRWRGEMKLKTQKTYSSA